MTDTLTDIERERLMGWIPAHRPDCTPFPRPTPAVLYRIVATDTGNVYAQRMDAPRRIVVNRRDADDEPWGDASAYHDDRLVDWALGIANAPEWPEMEWERRPRQSRWRALWRILTAKYRRVWG